MKPVFEWGMWLLIRASMLKEGLYVKNEGYIMRLSWVFFRNLLNSLSLVDKDSIDLPLKPIMSWRNNGQDIYLNAADRDLFLETISEMSERFKVDIFAMF